jgi:two-component system, cell cycle response regulator DivK
MKKPPLILLVDDFLDNREMYALFLKHSGFEVAEASNGHEALQQAFGLLPDLIVMDLSLPGLDGWEATRRLKQDVRTRHVPVLALTSHALEGFSEGARAAGCDGFVTKPCLPEQLVTEIRSMLEQSKRTKSKSGT